MGYLANQFKKVALPVVLASTLVTGGTAFAQSAAVGQAGPPPGPDNAVVQTMPGQLPPGQQPTVPQKPWQNDPNYVRIMSAYDHGVAAREKVYNANNRGQHEIQDANLQIQEANLAQTQGNYMRAPGGWAQYGAAQTQVNATHEAQSIQTDAVLRQQLANENIQRTQFMLNLDNQFRNLPQYKPGGAGVLQGSPPWSADPVYLQQMSNLDMQQSSQKQIDDAQTEAQLQVLGASQTATQVNVNAQAPTVFRQGLPGMARLSAQDQVVAAQYNMQRVAIEAGHEQRDAQRELQRAQFQFSLDVRYSVLPQYKNIVQPGAAAPGVRTPRPGA